jgi:hypothetical protein
MAMRITGRLLVPMPLKKTATVATSAPSAPIKLPLRAFFGDDLLANTTDLESRVQDLDYTVDQIANGSRGLLEEVATGKVTGEEEYWSRTDLWDFQANVDGARVGDEGLKPLLEVKDPELSQQIETAFTNLQAEQAYFVVKVDATHIKLAASHVAAVAIDPVLINIAVSGSVTGVQVSRFGVASSDPTTTVTLAISGIDATTNQIAFSTSHVHRKGTALHVLKFQNAVLTKAKQILDLSTHSMFMAVRGTSALVQAQKYRTSMQQCQVCTLAGQVGAHLRCGHLLDGAGFAH